MTRLAVLELVTVAVLALAGLGAFAYSPTLPGAIVAATGLALAALGVLGVRLHQIEQARIEFTAALGQARIELNATMSEHHQRAAVRAGDLETRLAGVESKTADLNQRVTRALNG